jgi:Protein of unknown function (DUF1449)
VSTLLAPALLPFVLAIGLVLVIALIEAVALLAGASPSHWFDGLVSHDGAPDLPDGGALGWLHIGKVPILALLIIFLTSFAVVGFVIQYMTRSATGSFMPSLVAVGLATVAGVFAVRILGAGLGKLVPKDESTAVADASLVGRIGTIVIGKATAGRPAETRTYDEHGTVHYVMVEPEGPGEAFEAGASVLLVRHLSGRRYQAIHNPKPGLL